MDRMFKHEFEYWLSVSDGETFRMLTTDKPPQNFTYPGFKTHYSYEDGRHRWELKRKKSWYVGFWELLVIGLHGAWLYLSGGYQ